MGVTAKKFQYIQTDSLIFGFKTGRSTFRFFFIFLRSIKAAAIAISFLIVLVQVLAKVIKAVILEEVIGNPLFHLPEKPGSPIE